MGKRPRIIVKKNIGEVPLQDEQSFESNLGSKNAKIIITIAEQIQLEIWFDKHYTSRNQHGDDLGPRIGINPERIINLLKIALKHILFYSARIKGFNFLNHESEVNTRIILKDSFYEAEPMFAVVQIHFKNFNKYECTVITARCNEFKIGTGQYYVEFFSASESTLHRIDNGMSTQFFSCQD